ncbi:MAG: hypothetical protein R3F34_09050 [Planctomycetota bacterium]
MEFARTAALGSTAPAPADMTEAVLGDLFELLERRPEHVKNAEVTA